ncbi:MAG: DUF5050 domain-containing protein [Ruminococcaceae bacterium]|nr:DUF5050 domain-containing protein [Oscillospiraceae bacterium]
MKLDLLCPVENRGVTIKTNPQTEEPFVLFKLFNVSDRVVTGVSFVLRAYDAYGGELGNMQVDIFDVEGMPKEFFATNKAVSLAEFPDAKHITVEFSEVRFADGDVYVKEGEDTDISITEPGPDEKLRLLAAAGDDAYCYPKDAGTYWVCVCGRANVPQAEACVRCSRDKEDVFRLYGSKEAVTAVIEEKEEALRLAEEERLKAEAEAKAKRVAKTKKIAIISAITIVSLLVLYWLGSLLYGGIQTLQGNRALKSGDYLAAYRHYVAADNSRKIATVSEQVLGNEGHNLWQSGAMTADEENLYYIDSNCVIYKEAKATGEKTELDAAGLFLNVSDGWLYYLDATTGQQLFRIHAESGEKELLYETADSYFMNLSLVGNELYFVLQEPRKNLTPAEQEQMALEGGNPFQTRLYRLKVGQKTPKQVSENEITQFVCYKDRIYYLDSTESAVYSIDRHGKDMQKLVSGPVYAFGLYEDALYYTDGTVDAETGQPSLALIKADMGGKYLETVIDDAKVVNFGYDGEDLYYVVFTGMSLDLYKRSGAEDVLISEGTQVFNCADGYVLYIDPVGQFMKTTFDKTGVEPIATAETALTE